MGVKLGNKLAFYLKETINKWIISLTIKDGILIVGLDYKNLLNVIKFLKYNSILNYDSLLDIWGVDYLSKNKRFEINYLLTSSIYFERIWLKVVVDGKEGVYSVVEEFKSACWLEREVWDMFGVYFINNPDLRRILTDYGFEGYPLRKDFPLSGYLEVRYDDGEKRVVTENVELTQDYRYFKFLNPWQE